MLEQEHIQKQVMKHPEDKTWNKLLLVFNCNNNMSSIFIKFHSNLKKSILWFRFVIMTTSSTLWTFFLDAFYLYFSVIIITFSLIFSLLNLSKCALRFDQILYVLFYNHRNEENEINSFLNPSPFSHPLHYHMLLIKNLVLLYWKPL